MFLVQRVSTMPRKVVSNQIEPRLPPASRKFSNVWNPDPLREQPYHVYLIDRNNNVGDVGSFCSSKITGKRLVVSEDVEKEKAKKGQRCD